MPIIAKAGATFKPAPSGTFAAVCVDVIDLGALEVTYAGKTKVQHKIRIVWQIEEEDENGRPFQVSRRYTLSLHEKAGLRKDLESWRGRAFNEEECQGFDIEKLLGVGCLLNIIHNTKDGSTYANVSGIMKLPKGMPAPTARDYVRVCDREPQDNNPAVTESSWSASDEDVPF